MMRRMFKDPDLQAQFDRNGYVRVQALEPHEVADLLERYQGLPPVADAGFFTAIFLDASHADLKRKISEVLADVGDKLIARYLTDYRRWSGAFVTKKPGRDSTVAPHQDWTYVDERECTSIGFWIPFCDTTAQNGALYFLNGGHRLGFTLRGPRIPSALDRVLPLLEYENLDYVPASVGDVIIFDHRVIHRSPANMSGQPRIAATINAVPNEAQLLHFSLNSATGRIEKYEPPLEYFTTYSLGQSTPPEGATFLGEVDIGDFRFRPAAVTALLAERTRA